MKITGEENTKTEKEKEKKKSERRREINLFLGRLRMLSIT